MNTEYEEYCNCAIVWGNSISDSKRTDGPCAISTAGVVHFATNSAYTNLERRKGPATILPTGEIRYAMNGGFHRLDGPAVVKADGTKKYYVKGAPLSMLEFFLQYGAM